MSPQTIALTDEELTDAVKSLLENMAYGHYIERDGVPVEAPDLYTWGCFMFQERQPIAKTFITQGPIRISTVFLGMPHGAQGRLYETMSFYDGGFPAGRLRKWHNEQWRYPTRATAKAGHAYIVSIIVRDILGEDISNEDLDLYSRGGNRHG